MVKLKIISALSACFIVLMVPYQARIFPPAMPAAMKTRYISNSSVTRALWRPHKNQLAVTYSESSDIGLVDAVTQTVQYILHTPSKVAPALGITDLAWSPDGRFLASAFEDQVINIWDLSNNVPTQPLVIHHIGRAPALAWSPTNDELASAWGDDEHRQILIWDTHTGSLIRTLEDDTNRFKWVLWSPDNRFLITYSWDGRLEAWDSHSYQVVSMLPNAGLERSPNRQAILNPDGDLLVGTDCSNPSGGCILWMWNLTTRQMSTPFQYPGSSFLSATPRWSADGKFLAVSDESKQVVYIWNTKTARLIETIAGFKNSVGYLSWSSSGEQLATSDGTIGIWRILEYF